VVEMIDQQFSDHRKLVWRRVVSKSQRAPEARRKQLDESSV
jgi:hypothetical protein